MEYSKIKVVLQSLSMEKYSRSFEDNNFTDARLKDYLRSGVLSELMKELVPVPAERFDIISKLKLTLEKEPNDDHRVGGEGSSERRNETVSCTICSVPLSSTWNMIWAHLKAYHSFRQRSCPFTCHFCNSDFLSFNRFSVHVQKHCTDCKRNSAIIMEVDEPSGLELYDDDRDTLVDPTNIEDPKSVTDVIQKFREDAITFAVELRSNPKVTMTLSTQITSQVSKLVNTMVSCGVQILEDDDRDLIEKSHAFSQLSSSFEPVLTSYKLKKYLLDCGLYIPAEELVLGTRTTIVKGKAKTVFDVCHYVPIIPVLEKVLQIPGVMRSVIDINTNIHENVFLSPVCGKYLRQKIVSSHIPVVLILAYYDEVEICNVLGARAGLHKVGNFYFSILNIDLKHNSKLENIYLLCSFKSCLLGRYTLSNILSRFAADLKYLHNKYIKVNTRDYTGEVKVMLGQFTGDNLGLHQLLGFSGSFSATYHCRFCRMPKYRTSCACIVDPNLTRNKDNYEEDIRRNDMSKTGVKSGSILNEICDFHVTDNYAPDVMHDILEGVAGYDIKLVVQFLLANSELGIVDLNSRIDGFDYAHLSPDKPEALNEALIMNMSNHLLGQSAAQTLTLLHCFPFLFGDFIPEECLPWKLLILLLQILDIILSTAIAKSALPYLKSLIEDHHYLYQVVSQSGLKPKHHHMLHYPDLIEQIGPLRPYWCMRFEARHRPFKHVARSTCNYRNITKTLCERNQLSLSYKFQKNEPFETTTVVLGKNIRADKGGVTPNDDERATMFFKSVTVNCRKLQLSNIVTIGSDDELGLPFFGKIISITSKGEHNFVTVETLHTIGYHKHYNSYAVKSISRTLKTINIEELNDPKPLLIKQGEELIFVGALLSV